MEKIKPRFFQNKNQVIAHLEWEAIFQLCFDSKEIDMEDAFPEVHRIKSYWRESFADSGTSEHHAIKLKLIKKQFNSLDEFYDELKPLLKPKPKGKALKDKKKRTAQSAYQRERLGEAFIENNELISAAKACAYELSESRADAQTLTLKANQLAHIHSSDEPLTEPQMVQLNALIQRQIDKHQKPDSVESKIIDEDSKNLCFMWCKIKRRYPVGDTFALPTKEAAEMCGCSKTSVAPLIKNLIKLGALTRIQAGKPGKHSGRAAIYRREI